MKILLMSDLAGKIPQILKDDLEDLDLVLIAGDITLGARSESRAAKTFQKLNEIFPDPLPVYFIPGNHDYPFLSEINLPFVPENFHQMHNNQILIQKNGEERNICLIGWGGAKFGLYNNFAFSEEEIESNLTRIFQESQLKQEKNANFVILLVHDPPYNTKLDLTYQNLNVGSQSIRKICEIYHPNLLVAGHIHESIGIDKIGSTWAINAGEAKYNHYALITIDLKTSEMEFFFRNRL